MHVLRTLLATLLVTLVMPHLDFGVAEAADPKQKAKPPLTPEAAKKLIEEIEARKGRGAPQGKASVGKPMNLREQYRQASQRQRDLELRYLRGQVAKKTAWIKRMAEQHKGEVAGQKHEAQQLKRLKESLVKLALAKDLPAPLLAHPIQPGQLGHIFTEMKVMGVMDGKIIILMAIIPEDAGVGREATSATAKMMRQKCYLRRERVLGVRAGSTLRVTKALHVVDMKPEGEQAGAKLLPVFEELDPASLGEGGGDVGKAKPPAASGPPGKAAFAAEAERQKALVVADLKKQLAGYRKALADDPNAPASTKIRSDALAEHIRRLESGQTPFEPVLLEPLKVGAYGAFAAPVRVVSVDGRGIIALARLGQTPFEKKNLKVKYVRIEGIKMAGINVKGSYQPLGVFRVVGEVPNKNFTTYRAGHVMTVRLHWAPSVDASENPVPREVAAAAIPEELKPYMAESDRQRKLFVKALQADGRGLYKKMVAQRVHKRFQTDPELRAEHEESKETLRAINQRISQLMNKPERPFVPILIATESMTGSMGKLPAWVQIVAVDGPDGLRVDATLPMALGGTMGPAKIDPERQPTIKMLLRPIDVARYQVGERQLVGGVWHITGVQALADGSKVMVAQQVNVRSIYGTNEP